MSTFSKPHIRLQAGITVSPDGAFADAGKPVQLRAELIHTQQRAGYAARIIYGQNEPVTFLANGNITGAGGGVRQVESLNVNAAAGATADGNLTVTVTKAGLTGSPVAVLVPLRANEHKTGTAIASAIAAALNANAAVAAATEAESLGSAVSVRSKYPLPNDATFNVAITAGLGVTAVASSINMVAGVMGVVVERLGGEGKDALGSNYPISNPSGIAAYVVSVPDDSAGAVSVSSGATMITAGSFEASGRKTPLSALVVESIDQGIAEVLVLTF